MIAGWARAFGRGADAGPGCEAVADLLVGVALNAAGRDDADAVQRHVARCARCASTLAGQGETAALLGATVRQEDPPVALRDRVFARALQERPAGTVARRLPRPSTAGRRLPLIWGGVAAAALALGGGSLALWATQLQSQLGTLSAQAAVDAEKAARYDRIVDVLESRDLAIHALTPTTSAVSAFGTIYLDPPSQSGMVMVHDLPSPGPDRAWQVWFARGTERVSGGTLWTDSDGEGYSLITVPPDLQTYEWIGVSAQPINGPPDPSSPRVIAAKL